MLLKSVNHIAIIVSCEEALDFYRKIGFEEIERIRFEEKNYTRIFMRNEAGITLEMFIKEGGPHMNNPESRGLRHVSFDIESAEEIVKVLEGYEVQKTYVMDNGKKIVFIYDYDKQPIEFAEIGSVQIG